MAIVGIIILTNNRPDLLKRALASVINQSYQDWELFIINDSDTEVSINSSDPRIQIIKNNNKSGANGARNTGINLARGEYIAFLDDDDAWDENKLSKQVKMMDSSSTILSYTGKKIIYQKNNTSTTKYSYKSHFLSPQFTLLLHNYIGTTSSIVIRRNLCNDNNNFDEELHSLQDYEYYLRLVKKGSFVGIPEGLVTYYFDDSISHISLDKKMLFYSVWRIFIKQRGIYRLFILAGLFVIVLQKIYKEMYYKFI